MEHPAWAEIDLKALRHNFTEIKKLARRQFMNGPAAQRVPWTNRRCPEILAVVKADAYGHGMLKTAKLLDKLGVDFLGVSDVAEGVELRKAGIRKPVLLFESTLPSHIHPIVEHRLTPSVCTLEFARRLNDYARSRNKKVDIHAKIDTGMGRLGVWHREAAQFLAELNALPFLKVKGVLTHFPVADTNENFTNRQIKDLTQLIRGLDQKAQIIPYVHASNSMGLGYRTNIFNLVRPGLMLYGLYPHPKLKRTIRLKPVMSVKARVIFVKKLVKGRGVSYGHTFVANKELTVATLPIGYSDGYGRCFSNRSSVLIDGKRCPVIGRVTMDQIMVDVSRIKGVKIGTEAVILGRQKNDEISADELACHAGTINYEVVCNLGSRLPHLYKY